MNTHNQALLTAEISGVTGEGCLQLWGELQGNINTTTVSLDPAQLIQPEDDIAYLFVWVTCLCLDVGKRYSLFRALNFFENRFCGRDVAVWPTSTLATASWRRRGGQQFFDVIQAGDDLFHISPCRDLVLVHKEFHHCVKTDGSAFSLKHCSLLFYHPRFYITVYISE